MPTQLPSGRWRTRVRHPRTGKQLPPAPSSAAPTPTRPEAARRRRERGARPAAHERPRRRHRPRVLERLDDRPALAAPVRARRTSTTASGRSKFVAALRRPADPGDR